MASTAVRTEPCGDPAEEGGSLRSQDLRRRPRHRPASTAPRWGRSRHRRASPATPSTAAPTRTRAASSPTASATPSASGSTRTAKRSRQQRRQGPGGDRRSRADSGEAYNSGWPCYGADAGTTGRKRRSRSLRSPLRRSGRHPRAPSRPTTTTRPYPRRDRPRTSHSSAISDRHLPEDGPFPDPLRRRAVLRRLGARGCIFYMLRGSDGRPHPSTVTAFMHHFDEYSGVDLEIGPDGDLYYASLSAERGGNGFGTRGQSNSLSSATSPGGTARRRSRPGAPG